MVTKADLDRTAAEFQAKLDRFQAETIKRLDESSEATKLQSLIDKEALMQSLREQISQSIAQ
jgi:hypothetical protein